MCLAIPGKILEIQDKTARVDIGGNLVEADISLLSDIKIGDFVIVHAGMALQKYDEKEANETLAMIREIRDAAQKENG